MLIILQKSGVCVCVCVYGGGGGRGVLPPWALLVKKTTFEKKKK